VGDLMEAKEEKRPKKIVRFLPNNDGHFTIWKQPDPAWRCRYVLGVDVAEGIEVADGTKERDYSTIEVVDTIGDKGKIEQVAEYRARIEPHAFAEVVFHTAKYYQDAFIIPEANKDGATVIRYLIDKFNYHKIYNREIINQDYPIESRSLGFKTHRGSKPVLINGFLESFNDIEQHCKIYSEALLSEMHTFIKDKKGLYHAAGGCHDDLVIAFALCIEGLSQCPRPKHREFETIMNAVHQHQHETSEIYAGANYGFADKYLTN